MLKHTRKQIASIAKHQVARLAKNEEGAALVEYGLLVGLIAVVCIGAIEILGTTINQFFLDINAAL
jgi:pilus assembly protein Flp/PilA